MLCRKADDELTEIEDFSMGKYEAELRRRLASGEPKAAVRRWYLECTAADKSEDWKDLSKADDRFQ
jgi:hypothetical protein